MMQLYYWETMNPRKACAVAKHLAAPVEFVHVQGGEHKQAAFLALNPNGLVPVLVDGDLKLWESAAIMAHLATKMGSDMWPLSEPARLVEVLRWVSWDAIHFAPVAGTYYFEHVIKPWIGLGEPDESALAEARPRFEELAKILDAHLEGTDFLVRGGLTIADFCVAAMLPDAQRSHMPLSSHPNVCRWHDRLMQLEAWRDPWPR
jgi:glutathione S-transferase